MLEMYKEQRLEQETETGWEVGAGKKMWTRRSRRFRDRNKCRSGSGKMFDVEESD